MNESFDYINLQSQLYLPIEYLPVCTLVLNKKGALLDGNSIALSCIGYKKNNKNEEFTRLYHKNIKLFYGLIAEMMGGKTISDRVLKIRVEKNIPVLIKCSGIKLGDKLSEIFIFQFTNITSFLTTEVNEVPIPERNEQKLFPEIVHSETFEQLPEIVLMTVMKMYPALSIYEATCFGLIALGFSNPQVALKLGKTRNSIGVTVCRILKKLNLNGRYDISTSYNKLLLGL